MAQVVIWLFIFALILFLTFYRWDATVSRNLDKVLPASLATRGENRLVWCLALAIVGATTMIRPVDVLLIAILSGLALLIGRKLACWAMDKANFH